MSYNLLTITKPASTTWQITLHSPPDNRLTNEMLAEVSSALDQIELEWRQSTAVARNEKAKKLPGGAVVFTSDLPKFFSNGLDYVNAIKDPNFHWKFFSPLISKILQFPLVTVAAITGHAFAGGFLFSLACDFRVMTNGKAWGCMNEIEFGAPFPPLFAALLRYRMPSPALLRKCGLGHRFTPPELLKEGLVDEIVDGGMVISRAVEIGQVEGGKVGNGSWGGMKSEMFYNIIEAGKRQTGPLMPWQEEENFVRRMYANGNIEKAKL